MSLTVTRPTHDVHCLTWGPDDGPLALCLHGFPDTAHTFRHLGPALAADGWRVVAPFSRGYAPTGIPTDGDYTVGALVADALAVREAAGGDERAVVVGHDWGAVTATSLAGRADAPFRRAVALAVPPLATLGPGPGLWGTWLAAVARQPRNSWYMLANQVPGLSERHFERLTRRLWRDWSPGYDAGHDLALLRDAVPDLEHARAVVSYYRAAARPAGFRDLRQRPPRVPTLVLHGDDDGCLDRRFLTLAAARLAEPSRAAGVPGTGHFLQLEDPATVNELVRRFVSER